MHDWLLLALVYGCPAGSLMGGYWLYQRRKWVRAADVYQETLDANLIEPASLHPVIDPLLCLGCASCVAACPEKEVLGIINRQAELIAPTACIGHGACRTACPTGAIELVFGTATRGVDIPQVAEDFQTNVPGIYIAGELGGMGLIRNAIEQGRQALQAIAANTRRQPEQLDVLIVGAGPAGMSAALAATEQGLSYLLLEQDSIGGTIAHYPRGKVVMTGPATLPIWGEFQFVQTSKEALVEFWHDVVQHAQLKIQTGARVRDIETVAGGFRVHADQIYSASNILLAIGRRGTPRQLGVAGEELGKVVYRLVDPAQYRHMRILVVGGGDSALEAAMSLAEEPGVEVTLSYRGDSFSRARARNRDRLDAAAAKPGLCVELTSTVRWISADTVCLQTPGGDKTLSNDIVLVCAGGEMPSGFLKAAGIAVETRFGEVR